LIKTDYNKFLFFPSHFSCSSTAMAVFTQVTHDQAQSLLDHLQLGQLTELKGIQGGIENTNYFLTSSEGEFVLTLFERLSAQELPFYLHLMRHLAVRAIPVPKPMENDAGHILFEVAGKPAALVNRLKGASELNPTAQHCQIVGDMLARMHLAGKDFELVQPNLRGLDWWSQTTPQILKFLSPECSQLLQQELAFQMNLSQQAVFKSLPRGPVHADLFRDNVMFDEDHLSGFFDFYFAGVDTWIFDLSVCLNDWCIDLKSGAFDQQRLHAFLKAYQRVRPLNASERTLINPMLRAGALRFWISRLWDLHLPRQANLLKAHDPFHFEQVLKARIFQPIHIDQIL
jgi:homoserine kinase type II